MRIGLSVSEPQSTQDPLAAMRATLHQAAADGYASAWLPHILDVDALTMIAVLAREVPSLELGTAVVPTYPRHPGALAQQALTTQLFAEGRLTLGIGTSHRRLIRTVFGLDFVRPADHMAQFLDILLPLLEGRAVEVDGDLISAHIALHVPCDRVPLLVAAMAPRMLRLAGARAEGTILWMTGPRTIESYIAPTLFSAAEGAGRARPRIVCLLPICVTDEPKARLEETRSRFDGYQNAPSYKAMLDIEGAETAADIAIIGDTEHVLGQLGHLAKIGVSDFVAVEVGSERDRARTREVILGAPIK